MTSVGMFTVAIIIWFEIVIFACLKGSQKAGVFYLAKANLLVHLLPKKISEGE
jgi:hypothetical protein